MANLAFFEYGVSFFQKYRFKKYQLKRVFLKDKLLKSPAEEPGETELALIKKTNVKVIVFDSKFTDEIREYCRNNNTTIAAAVISAALLAVRIVFQKAAEMKQRKLPSHQSWVVTSSTRHLLPNSKLLEGADKETDPSVMEFGGYGGSISNENFNFGAKKEVWDRCRKVKNHLNNSFLKSMRKMKIMNYFYRKPKIWNKLQGKVDFEKISRTYSVEVANLGAWNAPYAPSEVVRNDLATADWFAGSLNNSFLGARALFTIAVISINKTMSFSVAFDSETITEEEGELFAKAVQHTFQQMQQSKGNKISVETIQNSFSD